MGKIKYYDVENTLNKVPDAHYYVIIGERSNGKTYSTEKHIIKEYFENGSEFVYLRRFDEDIKQARASTIFNNVINDGWVEKYSNGEWNSIYYYARKFYFKHIDKENPKNTRICNEPFGYAISLASEEHDKSTAYPNVRNIFFEEFMSRNYLSDEFTLFQNALSTVIRLRDDIKIFMCGNTINKYSPYFSEMGLTNVKNMKKGTTEIYTYGDSGLKVCVEFSDMPSKDKKSNVYFAFNNPKLSMITGENGSVWEIDIYPHLTQEMRYVPKDVIYKYFVEWDNELLECEIVKKNNSAFTFIHRKTTPLRDDNTNLVYSTVHNYKPNYKRKITYASTKREKIILWFFKNEKVFYQSNEIGEIMRNYISWCKQTPIEY